MLIYHTDKLNNHTEFRDNPAEKTLKSVSCYYWSIKAVYSLHPMHERLFFLCA